MKDIYRGSLVRLSDESPEVLAKAFAKWNQDTEQHRLADDDPAQLWSEKKLKEFIEKRAENNPQSFRFSIRTLADDTLIGAVGQFVDSLGYMAGHFNWRARLLEQRLWHRCDALDRSIRIH
jgi:hypothetical protein